jgi:hypothetical protein
MRNMVMESTVVTASKGCPIFAFFSKKKVILADNISRVCFFSFLKSAAVGFRSHFETGMISVTWCHSKPDK